MPVGQASLGLARTIFSGSGAVTGTAATTNMKNSTLYATVPVCEAVDIYLNVTANTGTNQSVTGTYLELQTSVDGGTTWVPFWRSAQLTTSTTTIKTSMRTNGIGANEAAATTVAVNTATGALTQNCCITEDQRVAWTSSTSLGNSASITFGLYCIAQTSGSRAAY